jgi:tetratricopeptide (TPR) repeat protein
VIRLAIGALLLILAIAPGTFNAVPAHAECSPSASAAARQSYDTAYAFVQQGKWNTAIKHLLAAQESCPEHWESKELLAQAYMRTKRFEEAAVEYEALIAGKYNGRVADAEVRVLRGYGFALLKTNQATQAEEVYLVYHEKEPMEEEPLQRLVYVYEATERYADAIEYEKLLYEMNPDQHEYAKKIADLYKKGGDNAAAAEWYSMAAAAGVATSGSFSIGREKMQSQNYAEAVTLFEDYLVGQPESVPAWQNLGYCYTKLGQRGDAIAAYQKALAIDPSKHSIQSSLGFLYLDEGRVDDAEALAIDAVTNWPEDDKKKPDMYYLMGRVLERQGEYRSAIDMFDKIVEDKFWGPQAEDQIDRQRQLIAREEALRESGQGG